MAAFLFVTAGVVVLIGLVGLVAGHGPRAAWHRKALRATVGSR